MASSLANFLWSMVLGTVVVVIPIRVGLIFISKSNRVRRL